MPTNVRIPVSCEARICTLWKEGGGVFEEAAIEAGDFLEEQRGVAGAGGHFLPQGGDEHGESLRRRLYLGEEFLEAVLGQQADVLGEHGEEAVLEKSGDGFRIGGGGGHGDQGNAAERGSPPECWPHSNSFPADWQGSGGVLAGKSGGFARWRWNDGDVLESMEGATMRLRRMKWREIFMK